MSKERLTYRNSIKGEAYLKYGLAAKWEKMPRYDILDSAIQKLAEYEDLDEQGLLLRLPCKVGDTVWEIVDECEGDSAGCYGTCDACHNRRLGIEETKFAIDMTDEVGNWFFLTQSEAEEKLRELNKESEE